MSRGRRLGCFFFTPYHLYECGINRQEGLAPSGADLPNGTSADQGAGRKSVTVVLLPPWEGINEFVPLA